MMDRTVIIGGGQAAAQLAISLRQKAPDMALTLVCGEPHLPYMRPPLSKGLLKGETTAADLPFRDADFYGAERIDLRLGCTATGLDAAGKTVTLDGSQTLAFDRLVLATGTRARQLACAGADLAGIHSLRSLEDALSIAQALSGAQRVCVIGGGFIGLEFASAAAGAGKEVTVVEAGPRLMGRAVSPEMSQWFLDLHRANGVTVHLGTGVDSFVGLDGRVGAVRLTDGSESVADLVVVGVGVLANDALAGAAGLSVDGGIVVDGYLRASAPDIYAIGDCARFPSRSAPFPVRLESVQNAVDQAKYLGNALFAPDAPYAAVPWFWSEQFGAKLQIAGLLTEWDDVRRIETAGSASFSLEFYSGSALVAVESVNDPRTHLAARKRF